MGFVGLAATRSDQNLAVVGNERRSADLGEGVDALPGLVAVTTQPRQNPLPTEAAVAIGPTVDERFEALFDRERDAMVRVAYLLTGDVAVAEEVVQDAFVSVLTRLDRIRNPGAFLRRCVVNEAKGALRRRGRERDRVRAVEDQRPETTSELGARELLDALDRLTPNRRAVLVLRFYDQMTQEEIADALGLRLGTVKSNLHRGLAQLREALEP